MNGNNELLAVLEYKSGEIYAFTHTWDGLRQGEFIKKERKRKDDPLVGIYQIPISVLRNPGNRRSWLKICSKRKEI